MINDNHIDQIRLDLRNAGIDYEPLMQELIDHICCEVEIKILEGDNFENGYQKMKPSYMIKSHLTELQDDTKVLLDYKSLFLKKLFFIITGTTCLGLFFKSFKISGGNVIQFLSFVFLSLLYFNLSYFFFKDKRFPIKKKFISLSFFAIGLSLLITYWIYCFAPTFHSIATSLNIFAYLLLSLTLVIYFSLKTETNVFGVIEETKTADLLISIVNMAFALLSLFFLKFQFTEGLYYMLISIISCNFFLLVFYQLINKKFKNRLTSMLLISAIVIHIYHFLHLLN